MKALTWRPFVPPCTLRLLGTLPRSALISLHLLTVPSEKHAECAQNCAQTGVPKAGSKQTNKALVQLHLASKGDGLNVDRLHPFAIDRFRVSVSVRYTCRSAVRWPRG